MNREERLFFLEQVILILTDGRNGRELEDTESEKPTSLKLIRLLAELAYDDLTEQERRDLEIEIGSLALDYKKELENK